MANALYALNKYLCFFLKKVKKKKAASNVQVCHVVLVWSYFVTYLYHIVMSDNYL